MSRRVTLGTIVLVVLVLTAAVAVSGAEPSAIPVGLLETGDPRSEGEGPGLVGNPLVVLGAVVVLGLATALVTVLAARLLARD